MKQKEWLSRYINAESIGFVLNILSFIISLLGFLLKAETLIVVLFCVVYGSSLLFLCLLLCFRRENLALKKSNGILANECVKTFWGKNINIVIKELREAQNTVYTNYNKYMKELEEASVRLRKEENSPVHSVEEEHKINQEYYNTIKQIMNRFFREITFSLKNVLEFVLANKGMPEKISVCIEQLNICYSPGSAGGMEKLEAFSVYRDADSYQQKREIGKQYDVSENSQYIYCLKSRFADTIFIENHIDQVVGKSLCMQEDDCRRFYNAMAVIPVMNVINTERVYYGFLCADSLNTGNYALFTHETAYAIMDTYASFLSSFYYNLNLYFPDIFKYVNDNREKEGPLY